MSPTVLAVGLVAVGLVVLTVGASWLVKGAGALALRLGLTPLIVGLTVVAFGTSSPEFAVSIEAALMDNSAIALGNVVGSNLFNVALILGLAAVLSPMAVDRKLARWDVPVMVGAALAACAFLADGVVAQWEGALLVAGLVGYTVHGVREARAEARAEADAMTDEVRAAAEAARGPLWKAVAFVAAGLAALVVGASWLLDGAVTLASSFGVSQAVIGLTLVAAGTSLPELATSVVAARKGHSEIALGNVVGSNTFNVLGVLGLAAVLHPVARAGISWTTLGGMVALSALLWALAARGRLGRAEGAVLLAAYAGYVAYLFATAPGAA